MAYTLEAVAKRFFSHLLDNYDECMLADESAAELSWLNSAIVFLALEACREDLAPPERQKEVWCRFSVGTMGFPEKRPDLEKTAEEIGKVIRSNRRLNPLFHAVPDKIKEWLVDFSLSYGPVPVANDKTQRPVTGPFEMLMTAESELNGGVADVFEDWFRLIPLDSPLRVMVFKSNLADVRTEAKAKLQEQVARRRFPATDWLFLGIPTFEEWISHRDNDTAVSFQAFALRASSQPDELSDLPQSVWEEEPEAEE